MKHQSTPNPFLMALICLLACTPLMAQSPSPYTITGRVYDEANRRVQGARVCARTDAVPSLPVHCSRSDADGNYSIKMEKAGNYLLTSEKTEDNYFPQWPPFFRAPSSQFPKVTLDDNNTQASASILLGPKNGTLIGKVLDADTNLPVENAQFNLCHATSARVCWGASSKNDKGKFNLPAPHVPFTLMVRSEDYEAWLYPNGPDKRATALSVPDGTTFELVVYLKKRRGATDKALNEAEKHKGVNLDAPVQLSPADGAQFDTYPRTTRLEWKSVEGAASYSVEVDICDSFDRSGQGCLDPQPLGLKENPPERGIKGTAYEFNFIGAQPGRWRVWAIDADGHEGFKSPWRIFFYRK